MFLNQTDFLDDDLFVFEAIGEYYPIGTPCPSSATQQLGRFAVRHDPPEDQPNAADCLFEATPFSVTRILSWVEHEKNASSENGANIMDINSLSVKIK